MCTLDICFLLPRMNPALPHWAIVGIQWLNDYTGECCWYCCFHNHSQLTHSARQSIIPRISEPQLLPHPQPVPQGKEGGSNLLDFPLHLLIPTSCQSHHPISVIVWLKGSEKSKENLYLDAERDLIKNQWLPNLAAQSNYLASFTISTGAQDLIQRLDRAAASVSGLFKTPQVVLMSSQGVEPLN